MLAISEHPGYVEISNSSDEVAVLFLHGLGASGYDFVPWIQKFFSDVPIYWRLPHAEVRPVTWLGGEQAPAWYDLFEASTKSREDIAGLHLAAKMVHAQLDELEQLGYSKIFLGGFSQGAALSLFAGLSYKKSIAGIAAFSGYLPRRQHLSISVMQNVWLSHGDQDQVLTLKFHELTETSLSDNSMINLASSVWSGMEHEINNACSTSFRNWLITRINSGS